MKSCSRVLTTIWTGGSLSRSPGHFSPGAKIALESFTNDELRVTLQGSGYCFSHCQLGFGSGGGESWGVSLLACLCLVIVNIQHDQILEMIAENRIGPNTDNNDSISIISIIIILCLSERNFLTIPEHSWLHDSLEECPHYKTTHISFRKQMEPWQRFF